ncbi:MAG: saccharopine dehydrogenase family protein [Anaerolineae bacterium]
MTNTPWMIYGANGYTGQLLVEEAVRRGHRPLLAGRSADKLAPLAETYGLAWTAFSLDDDAALRKAVGGVGLVFHAAGPFIHTARPMRSACLAAGAHYLDITGEIPVLQESLALDDAARRRGIALISGAGFDVVPSDCLARHVASRLPGATSLELGIAVAARPSAGTAKSMLEGLMRGSWVRRGGKLVPHPPGLGARTVHFSHRPLTAVPIPWGDLVTAYHSTGIPNITVRMAYPRRILRAMRPAILFGRIVLHPRPLRRLAQKVVERTIHGPDAAMRQTARSYLWARAADEAGSEAQAWLETMEAYRLTAVAGVRCGEKLLPGDIRGALTPAQAFGADFVLELEGSRRTDG